MVKKRVGKSHFSLQKIYQVDTMYSGFSRNDYRSMRDWINQDCESAVATKESADLTGVFRVYAVDYDGLIYIADGHIDRLIRRVVAVDGAVKGREGGSADWARHLQNREAKRRLNGVQIAAILDEKLFDEAA